jgi:hypothetical protein
MINAINIVFIIFSGLLNELVRKEQHGGVDVLATCGVGVSMVDDTPSFTVLTTADDLVMRA